MKIANRFRVDVKCATSAWGNLSPSLLRSLLELLKRYRLSVVLGDLMLIDLHWYITHAGLLRLAVRKRCSGIHVHPVKEFCDLNASRYAFKALVYGSPEGKGFVGYGDADPSNVSPLLRGAEMRVAETRAVNRALRKAYGVGICSVEEVGFFPSKPASHRESTKVPEPANDNNGNSIGRTIRDRLCQLIRQHQLDATLVKSYATDFCGVKALRDATREQVENFVAHLADWADNDRNALLCQLNSYIRSEQGAA